MSLTGQMKEAISKSITWGVSMGLLYGSIRKVKDAFDFTVNVDTQMSQIAMVTGQTREQVQGLSDDYLQLAINLKASTEEILESAVALYRQGLNAQQVEERLTQITKAAQTSGVTVQQATDFVTVGINAMGLSAERFNDVLLKTASISATDYQALGEMIQKTGASFANANIELEKGVSWLAQVQETSRLASTTVGTAFKTIIARYSKVNESGLSNMEVLNDIETAYKKAGISIRGLDDQLRPIDELIDELAGKWNTLDTNTQNYIKTTVAGVRQGDIFLQLMNNYSRGLDIYSQNVNSAGTTTAQYNVYLDSLQAKLIDLENAWKKFYSQLFDKKSAGNILDFAINLVKLLSEVEDNIGLVNLAIAIMTARFVTLHGVAMLNTFRLLAFEILPQLVVSFGTSSAAIWEMVVASEALKASLTFGVTLIGALLVSSWIKHNKEVSNAKIAYEELNDVLSGGNMSTEDKLSAVNAQIKEQEDIFKNLITTVNNAKAVIDAFNSGDTRYTETDVTAAKKVVEASKDELYMLEQLKITRKELREEVVRNTKELKLEALANNVNADAMDDFKNSTEGLVYELSDLASEFDDINESKELTVEQISNLIDKYPEYLNYLAQEKTAKEAGLALINALFDAQKNESIIAIKGKLGELYANNALIKSEEQLIILRDRMRKVPSYDENGAFDSIDNLNSILLDVMNSTASTFNGLSKTKKSTKEYSDQLEKLIALRHELAMIESSQPENYDAQIAKIKEIQAELHNLNEEDKARLTSIDKGTQEYADLLGTINGRSEEWWSYQDKIDSLVENTSNSLADIANLRMKQINEDQENLNKLLETTVEYIKQQKEDQKSILEDKKEALQIAKKEKEFAEDLTDATKEVADLQSEIAELSLDNSQEGIAKRLELEDQLLEKQKEVTDLNYEYSIDVQEDTLDDQIDEIDDYLRQQGRLVDDAMRELNMAFEDAGSTLMQDLISWNSLYGSSIESDITSMWDSATSAVSKYKSALDGTGAFSSALAGATSASSDASIVEEMRQNGLDWWKTKDPVLQAELASRNESLANQLSYDVKKVAGRWYNTSTGIPLYGTGGRFDGNSSHVGIVGDVPETMITDGQMPSFLNEALRLALPKLNYNNIGGNTQSSINVNLMGDITVDSRERIQELTKAITKEMYKINKTRG